MAAEHDLANTEDADDGLASSTLEEKVEGTESKDELLIRLMIEYYSMLDRQGPGSVEVTKQALNIIKEYENGIDLTYKEERSLFASSINIADIGCGSGGQTMILAQELHNNDEVDILAVDMAAKFIEILNSKAASLNLQDKVRGVVGFMDQLDGILVENSLDIIWSEGAIYNVGFIKGLQTWRPFLRDGGYIAVTEISWLTPSRPSEIDTFWKKEYSAIDTISNKVSQMEESGYILVGSFILPQSCWLQEYYEPQEQAMKKFLETYGRDNQTAKELIASHQHEIELYKKYKDYYGYVFYIGQKRSCIEKKAIL